MGVVGLGTSGRPLFKRVTSGYIEKTRERKKKWAGKLARLWVVQNVEESGDPLSVLLLIAI